MANLTAATAAALEGQQTSPEPVTRGWNKAVFRVVLSFARGLGISIGLSIVVLLAYGLDVRNESAKKAPAQAETPARWFKRFGPGAKVKVASEEVRGQGSLVVLGKLMNEGSDSWKMIQVEARFFDAAGKIVALCGGYSSGSLRPGHQQYFLIDCGGVRGMKVPEYASHQVEVVDASYEVEDGT